MDVVPDLQPVRAVAEVDNRDVTAGSGDLIIRVNRSESRHIRLRWEIDLIPKGASCW